MTYTVTFSEPVTPDPTTNDFDNAAATGIEVESVTRTSDVECRVVAKAAGTGSLQLQIASGVAIEDLFGNALVTPAPDDDTLTVEPLPQWKGELGALKPWANGGINPATGNPWEVGDQYRLAFFSSATTQATSTNITTYNAFVQGLADAAGLGGGTWRIIGSTETVVARDNTGTNPGVDGTGVGIFLVDGATKIADSNNDLWDGSLDAALYVDENGTPGTYSDVWTGSNADGTGLGVGGRNLGGSTNPPDSKAPKVRIGRPYVTGGQWMVVYNAGPTSSKPVYALSDPLTIQSGKSAGLMIIVR